MSDTMLWTIWLAGVVVCWVVMGAVEVDVEEDFILFVLAVVWPALLLVALLALAVGLAALPFYLLGGGIRRMIARPDGEA